MACERGESASTAPVVCAEPDATAGAPEEVSAELEGAEWVAAHFDKREVRVPMRDGVTLHTTIYTPKREGEDDTQTYPILFKRTPYSSSPYGEGEFPERIGPSEALAKSGYIFVYQDVRGRFMSEGEFINMRPHLDEKPDAKAIDESSDTYDSVDWLVKNVPNNNGRVGMWGIS
jgi:putative CocE/NonD family hydrolase